jgi:hypothetical protein
MNLYEQDRMNWKNKGKKDCAFEEFYFQPCRLAFA